ncbi:MAG: DUF6020 family protein [Oscillospiraceae bacterium]|jgi:hypothetical protein|nr:DUF6020 family protein [Oscillospiraceae bacterium]
MQYCKELTSHHPPLHTLLLIYVISFASRFGDINSGIAVFVIAQMIFAASVFSFTLHKMHQWKVLPFWRYLALLWFAFFPTVCMFVLCTTKDTLFSLFTLLFVVQLTDTMKSPKARLVQWINVGILAFIMLLLRNNAIYAFILFLPFFLLTNAKHRKKGGITFGAVIVSVLLVTNIVYPKIMSIPKGSLKEMLCVPTQQLARVYHLNPQSITAEERQKLVGLINENCLKLYDPQWADLIKNGIRLEFIKKDPSGFLELWLKLGLRNPKIYLDSFLLNTVQGWFPNAVMDGYNSPPSPPTLYPYDGTSYFEFNVESPGKWEQDMPNNPLTHFYYNISKSSTINRLPILGLLFSPSALLAMLVFCVLFAFKKTQVTRSALFAPLLYVLLLCTTVFLGPIMLPRYFLILFFIFPLMVAFIGNYRKFLQGRSTPC